MAAKMCNVCNKRRGKTGSKGTETSPHADMCNYCWEEGGWENTHSDAGHEHIDLANMTEADKQETSGCWICWPELNLAQKPSGKSTGTKTQGDRRPQLNHKGHSHPATPAARRECKKAFWAIVAYSDKVTPEGLQEAMNNWDSKLDGHGKPISDKEASWTVVPSGPKGGVINQLKRGKPESFTKRLGKAERALAEAAGLVKPKGNPAK